MKRRQDQDETFIEARDLNLLTRGFGGFIPRSVAKRAVAVSVETDRERYQQGDQIQITVELKNRIPFPIELMTAGRRIWGWRVDGLLHASDEPLHESTEPQSFSMEAWETLAIDVGWDGRFKRAGTPTRWEKATPGEYEIEAFLATDPPKTATKTIELQ